MLPSPTELHYFLEVSKTLNISRAAERLGVSQPTLTLAMKRLEESCGVALLIRSKSGVQLTQSGQKLATQTRELLRDWEKIRSDTARDEDEIRGHYTLGCHPSVAMYSLPSFFKELLTENSGLEFRLTHDLSRKITEDVISFKIDFGIVVNPWEHPDLVIRKLSTDQVTLWVSKKPNELQDPKSDNAVLICDPELVQTQSIVKQLAKKGLNFKRTITSTSLEVITTLVAAQGGVGVLPSRVALRIKEHGLKPLMKDGPKFEDTICLVYRADVQKSKASRKIAKRIEELFLSQPNEL